MVGETVLLLALFGVVAELACRIEDRIRFGTPMLSRYRSPGDLLVRDTAGVRGRPNASYQQWAMNNLGLRGPNAPAAKLPGTVRIITVGASETFGSLESKGREYPRQLEDSLTAIARLQCGLHAPSFEVLNAGLPGMSMPTVEQHARTRLMTLQPDVMVVYPTPVQYLNDLVPQPARADSTPEAGRIPWTATLSPRFATRLRSQIKALLPAFIATRLRQREIDGYRRPHGPDWVFREIPADRMTAYQADLQGLIATIRAAGVVPVVMTHANALMQPGPDAVAQMVAWEKFYPRATGRTIVAFDSAARGITMGVAADSGVPSVDLAGVLMGGPMRNLFTDFSHFSDAGAARVAGAVAPTVFSASGGCAGNAGSAARPSGE